MPPKKAKKNKGKASAEGSAFAIDFSQDLGKKVHDTKYSRAYVIR